MSLNKINTRRAYARQYRGQLQKITILKRDDDQREGVVRAITVFNCRRSSINKTGEQILGDMTSDHQVTWHIPTYELNRMGINYLNSLDRIVDPIDNVTYQPESTTNIDIKLFGNQYDIACLRI